MTPTKQQTRTGAALFVRLDPDLLAQLKAQAARENRSVTAVVERLLRQGLARLEGKRVKP